MYQEPELILKTIRDLYSDEISEIVIDDPDVYKNIYHLIDNTTPAAKNKLKLYDSKSPIFDYYEIEVDISRVSFLIRYGSSGGYLVVDQTEALTSFDVNSGKNVGQSSARETIINTNLEAAKEIADQLRLRNLGGIIIIDFIDMEAFEDQEKVNNLFTDCLSKDKARTTIYSINELGLIQMTRKRTQDSLGRLLTEECSNCQGQGRVLSKESLLFDISRDIIRQVVHSKISSIELSVREDVYELFHNEEKQTLDYLEQRYGIDIVLKPISAGESFVRQIYMR